MSFNLATILRESALADPEHPLLRVGSLELSYQQVDVMSGRVASGLRDAGLGRGDTVALQLPNVPEFVFTYFGALKAGVTVVPLNPLLKAPEIAYHLQDSGAQVLITFDAFADEALKGAAEGGARVFVVGSAVEGADPFDQLYGAERYDIEPMNSDDTAVIIYTSGTTGRPKGAELTHFQLYMASSVAGDTFDYRDDDVSMAVLPLFHVFGLSSVMNTAIRCGATLVLVPRFDVGAVLDAVERHRVTVFCGVPTMFVALLHADLTGRDVSSLRVCVSGGASIPGEVLRGFEAAYGGVPVLKGYLGRPEATEEAMRGGWFHTGDLGYRDEDGFFYIVDRKKDLVIRGGFNVYPREIEEVLHQHPAVLEAAVIGRPDDRLGEEVVAFIALKHGTSATPDEVVGFCKERLAAYKYPREVVVLDELPKGGSGKVLKTELRAAL